MLPPAVNLLLGEFPFFDSNIFSDNSMPLDNIDQLIQLPETPSPLLHEMGTQITQELTLQPYQQQSVPAIINTTNKPQAKSRKPRDRKKYTIFKLKKAPHKPIRALFGPSKVTLARRLLELNVSQTRNTPLLFDASESMKKLDAHAALESIMRAIPWSRIADGVPDARFLDAIYQGNTIYAVPDVDIRPLFRHV